MSEDQFLKCACSYCRGHLEFPAYAVGITTTCPHCGVETKLVDESSPVALVAPVVPARSLAARPPTASAPPPPPPPPVGAAEPVAPPTTEITSVPTAAGGSKIKQVLKVTGSVIVGLLILAGAGFKLWTKFRRAGQVVEIVAGDSKAKPKDAESSAPDSKPVAMAPPVAPATSIVVAKGTPPPRKAGEDLQVISYEVQRAKEGSLQYVIGVVTNHSAKQFFNVKLEFELARKEGKGGDTATDLIRNLPANTAVPFKASIIGTAPVTGAKLAKLEGEKE